MYTKKIDNLRGFLFRLVREERTPRYNTLLRMSEVRNLPRSVDLRISFKLCQHRQNEI